MIHETKLIEVLRKQDPVRIQTNLEEKCIYILSRCLMVKESWIDIPKVIKWLKDNGYVDSLYKPTTKGVLSGKAEKIFPELSNEKVEKTAYLVEADIYNDGKIGLARIFKRNGKYVAFQQAYVDVFNCKDVVFRATCVWNLIAIQDKNENIIGLMCCIRDDVHDFIEMLEKEDLT